MAEFLFSQAPDLASLKWIATDIISEDSSSVWKEPLVDAKTLAFLQYTSGSTGKPKGVMLTHGNLLHNLKLVRYAFEVDENTRGGSWLPPYHDMGLIGGILGTLYNGIWSVLMSPLHFLQRPLRWLQAISRYQVTTSGAPNFAFDLCARKVTEEQLKNLDLSRWTLAFCGAEPIRPETVERFAKTFEPCGFRKEAFYPCYGLAEGTLIVSGGKKGTLPFLKKVLKEGLSKHQVRESCDSVAQAWIGCGKNLPDQEIRIVNPETSRACASDEVGEIWVKGPSVAQGYWDQPEETERIFWARVQEGQDGELKTGIETNGKFLRTGDLGFLKEGHLFVTGRLKDLVIIRGQNHYPQDIEQSVEQAHPQLRPGCGAVFSVEAGDEEQLVVVQELETDDGSKGDDYGFIASEIRRAVLRLHELDAFSVVLIRKGALPKTSSGKISRFHSRLAFLEGQFEPIYAWKKSILSSDVSPAAVPAPAAEPAKKGETRTAQAIKEWFIHQLSIRLGLNPKEINVETPIASYGLDSKDAINLSGELEEWLGKSFSPTLIWKYPTIEKLAHYLSSGVPLAEGSA
jgi:acyl-CoA synthetase (AMP-forming)/AMP-acid ligase II/acyl carrier protein